MAENSEKIEVELTLSGIQTIQMLRAAIKRAYSENYELDWPTFMQERTDRVVLQPSTDQEPIIRKFKCPCIVREA